MRIQPQTMAHTLRRRHWLRLHGVCMGLLVLLVMWAASAAMLHAGVQSMAARYAVSLGAGYGVYLLVLRLWAAYLVRSAYGPERKDSALDGLDATPDLFPHGHGHGVGSNASYHTDGGGDFGGGGASGDWAGASPDAGGSWVGGVDLGDVDLGGADEGIILVPILALFAGLVMSFLGLGALLWLYFGVDALLAVAVELAFSMMAARALVRVEREGWLLAAVRLSWKPLLGALVCAVALGALMDWWLPQANTLREVLAYLHGKG